MRTCGSKSVTMDRQAEDYSSSKPRVMGCTQPLALVLFPSDNISDLPTPWEELSLGNSGGLCHSRPILSSFGLFIYLSATLEPAGLWKPSLRGFGSLGSQLALW